MEHLDFVKLETAMKFFLKDFLLYSQNAAKDEALSNNF